MIRNLKALGLALVAVFAMSAMAAGAAQAEEAADFSAAEYPATIDALHDTEQIFDPPSLPPLTCEGVEGEAELKEETDELTGENVVYTTCHVVTFGVTFPITVDTTGCHFTFTAHTYDPAATEGDGAAVGDVHIENCENGGITITVFKAGSSGHPEADLRCTIHVPNQTPNAEETKITYLNEWTEGTKGTESVMAVTVEADDLEVKSTITESTICGNEREETAIYNGAFWAKATDGSGNYIDTTVTGTP